MQWAVAKRLFGGDPSHKTPGISARAPASINANGILRLRCAPLDCGAWLRQEGQIHHVVRDFGCGLPLRLFSACPEQPNECEGVERATQNAATCSASSRCEKLDR